MKISAVIGSPRKMGNTYRVVEQVRKNLMKLDMDIEFEYIFLRDVDLKMCNGCFACISHDAGKCPLKDGRKEVEAALNSSDGIIFAAPGYAMGVPGLMKNFIDRFAYTCHRPSFFDKAVLLVTTIGSSRGMKQTLDQLAVLSGGGRKIRLGITTPPIPMKGAEKAEKKIEKASREFHKALKKGKKLPGAEDWVWFYAFKTFCSVKAYQKVCPGDVSYYKDKKEYFYPLKGHYLRRLLGRTFKVMLKLGIGLMAGKGAGEDK